MERTDEAKPCPSRRDFLLAGGTVVTALSLGRGGKSATEETPTARGKIREIMLRYGSELGSARFIED